MSTGIPLSPGKFDGVDRFHAALRNLNDLDKHEIRNVVGSALNPTLRERYVALNYHRAVLNLELLLTLTDSKQFQAISMLARTNFELAVELKLINKNADAAEKVDLFTRIEKLRSAEQIVKYKKEHPEAKLHYETQEEFIKRFGPAIRKDMDAMWPGTNRISHWTKKDLRARAGELGGVFELIYEMSYPFLSWHSQSGVTGVATVNADAFAYSAGVAYNIAVDSHMEILGVIVNEFKLHVTDPSLKNKIQYAKGVAFTESQQEADGLRQDYGV
jgi:hypothetical protein